MIILLLSGCAKYENSQVERNDLVISTETQEVETIEFTVQSTSDPELILENQEKQLIIDFYDAIYALNSGINKTTQYSLSNAIEKYKTPISVFFNYEPGKDSSYSAYIKKVQNMQQAVDLMSNFIEAEYQEKWDDEIYKLPYVFMLDWFTADLLSVELPFEYEGQVFIKRDKIKQDYIQCGVTYLSYMNQRIDDGGNIYCDMPSYAPNTYQFHFKEKEIYDTDKSVLRFTPDIFYNGNTGNYEFSLVFEFMNTKPTISFITINDVTINSTKIKTYNLDYYTVVARIYNSSWDDMLNQSYNDLVKGMQNSEIIITINDNISFTLTDEDRQQFESYILDFNTLYYVVEDFAGTGKLANE